MKTFLELAKKRKTTYEFALEDVPDTKIKKILEASRWAPNCGNVQPWRFIIIRNKVTISKVLNSTHYLHKEMLNPSPPILIAFVLQSKMICSSHCSIHQNEGKLCMAMAVQNALLQAEDMGIASCVISPKPEECFKALKLRVNQEVVLLMGLGYPKQGAARVKRERLPLDQLIFYEAYGKKAAK